MLKREGQPEKKRHGRRWLLLLLMPPVGLLVWALIGLHVQWGDWHIRTGWTIGSGWSFRGPMPRNSEFDYWTIHLGNQITVHELRFKRAAFRLSYGRQME